MELVPTQQRRLLLTLILTDPGVNWYSLEVSYSSDFPNAPCVIDSRCRLVAQGKTNAKSTIRRKTVAQCLSILTSFGRKLCLLRIEIEKNKPLGLVETRQRLLASAFTYSEDANNSLVRNLYDTVLQYRCPFGQEFSINNNQKTIDIVKYYEDEKQNNNKLVASYNINCRWNQTWGSLYDNGTSLPTCVGRNMILRFIIIYQ